VTRPRQRADARGANAPRDLACACATARQVARVLTQLYDSRLRDTGVEAPQFALMMALDKQGPCSQGALGRRHALDKTTVSRNLKLLERNGWIASSVADDRRERQFTLTTAGRRTLAAAKPEWKKAQDQLRSGMAGAQWDAMFRVFRTVTETAQSIQREAGRKANGRRRARSIATSLR
jgi:DNA-binding MarR family transcriptional regulator